jgi:hypothetical protein
MTKLSITKPEIGKPDSTEDVKLVNALTAIEAWANGEIDTTNLAAAAGITEGQLSSAVRTLLNQKTAGGETHKFTAAAELSRESAVYGKMSTPDQVEVTLAQNGVLAVFYQATWKGSATSAISAALFLGANQLKKVATQAGAPTTQEAHTNLATEGVNRFLPLASSTEGLVSAANYVEAGEYAGDVATGQVFGAPGGYGPCFIFAEKGTYQVSVQFKASAGKVTVKNRQLLVLVIA